MNIPFVKVNNQQEFERVVDKMQRETGLERPINCSYDYVYSIVGLNSENTRITCWMKGSKTYISADEYLTGIKTDFTLSDLEDGMVVELRNSRRFMYLSGTLVADTVYMKFDNIKEDFTHKNNKNCDFVKIYKLKSSNSIFSDLLRLDCNLTLIFDAEAHRNKFAIEQKKIEIQSKIDELKLQLEELNNGR